MLKKLKSSLAVGVVALGAGAASGTWSIVLIDTRTGEVALGSATCLFNFDLQANTPVLLPMVGGATAQSSVDADGTNRVFIRDALLAGVDMPQILSGLAAKEGGVHQTRQYGMGDVLGRTATFSGTSASAWAGGITGSIPQDGGDIVYAVQGNILTGPPVVQKAVDAILATDGDLAARMMAGMEAARSMGGDGRCSCSSGPTACGSPPSTPWERTAGIAYMLIARDGDVEASTSVYRVPGAWPMASADFDQDGDPDLAVGYTGNVGVMRNLQRGPGGPAVLAAPQSIGNVSNPRAIFAGDLNADARPDIASVNLTNANSATFFMNTGGGSFAAPISIVPGGTLLGMARGDLDADNDSDFVTLGTTQIALIRNNNNGTFQAPVTTPIAAGAGSIAMVDANADGRLDVLITYATARQIAVYFNDGTGGFTLSTPIPMPSSPFGIDVGDIDADGTPELLTTSAADRVLMVTRRNGGAWETSSITVGTGLSNAFFVDLNNDGRADIGAPQRPSALLASVLRTYVSKGDGTFDAGPSFEFSANVTRGMVNDMNGDSRPDLVLTLNTGSVVHVAPGLPAAPGAFNFVFTGAAAGEYYMEFNHPFRPSNTVDPVFLLQDDFDAWRDMLVDVPDAIRTEAVLSTSIAPATGAWPLELIVTLRDWQGSVVTRPMNVTVSHRGPDLRGLNASDGISEIGAVVPLGNGQYRVPIRTGSSCGLDRFRIAIADPATPDDRPVIVMPAPRLTLSARGDVNLDGVVNQADLEAFFLIYDSEEGLGDINADGLVDLGDFLAFFNFYDGGCGGVPG